MTNIRTKISGSLWTQVRAVIHGRGLDGVAPNVRVRTELIRQPVEVLIVRPFYDMKWAVARLTVKDTGFE